MLPAAAIVETIQVMLHQEVYYNPIFDVEDTCDSLIRTKMVDWCCQVIEFCKLDMEIAVIAMNYADRMYAMHPLSSIQSNLHEYQLTVMTSLYIAAKIHAAEALDPKLVSNLSRQLYTPQQVEECERKILSTLSYKVNPITAYAFLHPVFELLQYHDDGCTATISIHEKEIAMKFAFHQIDIYVNHYHCSTSIRHSMVAYCAFMNAIGYISMLRGNDTKSRSMILLYNFGYSLAHLFNIDLMDKDDVRLLTKTQHMLCGDGGNTHLMSPSSKCTILPIAHPPHVYHLQPTAKDCMITATNKRSRENDRVR